VEEHQLSKSTTKYKNIIILLYFNKFYLHFAIVYKNLDIHLR